MSKYKTTDKTGAEIDVYRFELGSLYKYDRESGAYIHVFKNAFANTKAKAIKAYEEALMND